MNALPHNLTHTPGVSAAVTAALRAVPTGVRVLLWCAVAAAVLMALGVGIAMIAGNNSKDARLGRTFTLVFLAVMAIQGGYVLAPLSVGRAWWVWSFWLMVPIALLVLCTAMVPIIGAIRWTRPDGASGWKTIADMGWMSMIGVAAVRSPARLAMGVPARCTPSGDRRPALRSGRAVPAKQPHKRGKPHRWNMTSCWVVHALWSLP